MEDQKFKDSRFYPARIPHKEWGGKVCCNKKELYLSDLVTSGMPDYIRIGQARCKEGDETVATFHNHPNATRPSDPDKRIARKGTPSGYGPDQDNDGLHDPLYDPNKDSIPPGLPVGATKPNGDTSIYDPKNGNPNSFPYVPVAENK